MTVIQRIRKPITAEERNRLKKKMIENRSKSPKTTEESVVNKLPEAIVEAIIES